MNGVVVKCYNNCSVSRLHETIILVLHPLCEKLHRHDNIDRYVQVTCVSSTFEQPSNVGILGTTACEYTSAGDEWRRQSPSLWSRREAAASLLPAMYCRATNI